MNRRTALAVFFFLLVQSCLAYLIFNHTTRERTPTTTVPSEEDVTCIGISHWGDSLVVGTTEGTVSYYRKGKTVPQWMYRGKSGIATILVSGEGDYVITKDMNHTVFLFRSLSIGMNTAKWTHQLTDGQILDVYSSNGIPPIVYMLASVNGHILLFSDREGLLWDYSTGERIVTAEISYNGKTIAALDDLGQVYIFDIFKSQPVWVFATGITNGVISLSQASRLVVGGSDSLMNGEVLSLSLKNYEALWEWSLASPVTSISMSSDGSKVIVLERDGKVSVITAIKDEVTKRELRPTGDTESVWSPPFGSYVVTLDAKEHVSYFYSSRTAPLWVYDVEADVVDIAVTSMGDKIFVADRSSVTVITNSIETGMIPGSRILWGVWFLLGFVGQITVNRVAGSKFSWLNSMKRNFTILASGLVIGVVFGFVVWRGALEVIAAAVSCAVGCYFGSNKEDLGGFFSGLFISVAGSMSASIVYGLFLWFSGVESNIVVLVVTSISDGTRVGFFCGFLGIFLGFLFAKLGRTRLESAPSVDI